MDPRRLTALALLAAGTVFAAEPPVTAGTPVAPEPPAPAVTPAAPAAAGTPDAAARTGPVEPPPPPANEPPKPAPPRTVTGTVRSIETSPPRVVVDSGDGPQVTFEIDRNTAIYLQTGVGTVRDVRAGEPVRVSVSGADQRALWVEVMKAPAPGQSEGATTTTPSVPPAEMAAPRGVGVPGGGTSPPTTASPSAPVAPGR
ncbi:MAG TPA: hypothetical protein VFK85_08565 [Anaeromyxobacteraceae bacterium]|nr:hypothetical protein [Anaeromyxobacteraceae bacterium]